MSATASSLRPLVREDAGKVQGISVVRIGLEDAAIDLTRFDELFVFLQQDRERDGLVERQLTGR
jgi:hypothetical protein